MITLVKNNDTLHLTNGIKTRGDSAYEVAVANGFEGTEEEWLASLKGDTGEQGEPGVRIGTTPPEDESLIWINPLSNVEDYATKQYVDDAIAAIPEVDLSDYATQKYVDDAIAGIDFPETDLSDYYTKTEVDNLIPKEPDLSGYALKTEIPDVSSYTTMAAVEAKGYQTEAQVLDLIEEHGGGGSVDVDLSDYYTKDEVDGLIPTVPTSVSELANDAGYQTEEQVQALIAAAITEVENGTY